MSIENTLQTFEDITPDMIQAWKSKNPNIFLVEIPLDELDPESDSAKFYVKTLSNSQQNALMEVASDKKLGPSEALKSLKKMAILGGDMKYLEDGYPDSSISNALMEQVGDLVGKKKASLKRV